ncbi:MAG: cysteine desulfurase family protein [Lutimonas sp.]
MKNKIYLDYNATTPCDPLVLDAMLPYFTETFGNPSSAHHAYGWLAEEAVTEATNKIAKALKVSTDDLIYTSGATESINTVLKSIDFTSDRNHIITCRTEHKAVLDVCHFLESTAEVKITYVDVDAKGIIDLMQLAEAICTETILVAVMHANNETGVIQPLQEVRKIIEGKGIYLFSDATQSLGKVALDDVFNTVDFACFSAHKVYGPKGIGLLYAKDRAENKFLQTLIHGGGMQKKMRGGTLNTPSIVGFAKAVELSFSDLSHEQDRLRYLRDKLEQGLLKIEHARSNGKGAVRLPNSLNISFAYVDGFKLLSALSKYMAVSNGSACNSANETPSHVLLAMGIDPDLAFSSIRMSLGKYTSESDIDQVIEILTETVASQRADNILWERRSF